MPNNNYARGAAFENKVKAALEKDGWYAVRAAGSHGLTDVIALRGYAHDCAHDVLFIQCKTGKARMTKAEKIELHKTAERHNATPILAWPGPLGYMSFDLIHKDGSTTPYQYGRDFLNG